MARICSELVYGFTPCKLVSPDAPQADADALARFQALKAKVDQCMAGCRMAKDRAGNALAEVMIPEALDYPIG